jgi:hypothetical protein
VVLSADGTSATLGARNEQRFKPFSSLELRAQYTMPIRHADLQLFVELRNTLNHDNECCRDVEVNTTGGNPAISLENSSALGVIPIAGFNLKF